MSTNVFECVYKHANCIRAFATTSLKVPACVCMRVYACVCVRARVLWYVHPFHSILSCHGTQTRQLLWLATFRRSCIQSIARPASSSSIANMISKVPRFTRASTLKIAHTLEFSNGFHPFRRAFMKRKRVQLSEFSQTFLTQVLATKLLLIKKTSPLLEWDPELEQPL